MTPFIEHWINGERHTVTPTPFTIIVGAYPTDVQGCNEIRIESGPHMEDRKKIVRDFVVTPSTEPRVLVTNCRDFLKLVAEYRPIRDLSLHRFESLKIVSYSGPAAHIAILEEISVL